jgi:hypothetical protein
MANRFATKDTKNTKKEDVEQDVTEDAENYRFPNPDLCVLCYLL